MNAPARFVPPNTARVTYQGRTYWQASNRPRHRQAIWAPPHRHLLTRRQAAAAILITPILSALLVGLMLVTP